MRVILFLIGGVGLALSGCLLLGAMQREEGFWTGCLAASAGATGAVGMLTAATKRYRGSWPFVIGIALIVFAFGGLGREIDDRLAEQSQDAALGALLIALFSSCGVLLLYSGHRLHRCLGELEALRGSHSATAMPNAEPWARPNGGPAEPLGNSGVSGGPLSVS